MPAQQLQVVTIGGNAGAQGSGQYIMVQQPGRGISRGGFAPIEDPTGSALQPDGDHCDAYVVVFNPDFRCES